MMFINIIIYFFGFNILLCVSVSNVTGNSDSVNAKSLHNYGPSPYNLEDYCMSEEDSVDFHIDSWKGAIFHIGKRINSGGLPKSRKIHKCKINIKTKTDFWLTAATEHMKIRGSRDSSNRWQCSDYVQFSSPARHVVNKLLKVLDFDTFSDKKSEKLCGNKQLDGDHFENIFDLSTDANSFSTASNVMAIVFHQDNDKKHTANNSLSIVVTSFRHASEEVFAVECEGKQKCNGRRIYCIDNSFRCDGHVNCAFPGSGTDETHCPEDKTENFNMTSIIIIALTATVGIGIVICILSTAICRLRSFYSNERRRATNPAPTSMSLTQYPAGSGLEPLSQAPTAPMVQPESTLPPYELTVSFDHLDTKKDVEFGDADLPPKYESLFPEGPLASPSLKEDSSSNPATT